MTLYDEAVKVQRTEGTKKKEQIGQLEPWSDPLEHLSPALHGCAAKTLVLGQFRILHARREMLQRIN
jgi:hypothetical protein